MQVLFDYIYELNWFAIVIASLAGFLVNAAWYSDKLFGKQWKKSIGLKKKDESKPGFELILAIAFLTTLITSASLAVLTDVLNVSGALNGVLLGVLVAFGFIVTTAGMHELFERRQFSHFAITSVGNILTLAAIGAILAVW
jgi:hypothetical protein